MTVKQLIDELNKKCSSGLRVRVSVDGEYFSLREITVDYENTEAEDKTSSEVYATITTYSNKLTDEEEDDPWLGDYKPYASDKQ